MRRATNRQCVFCGASEVTDEHVWPEWVSRFLNDEVLPDVEFGKSRYETDPSTLEKRQLGRKWGGPQLDIKVKRVCEPCNGRWMSDIEKAAIPYLKPMIQGEQVPLDKRAREIVATWAFLRAVMAEYTHPEQIAVPESHRRWLYKERKPPRYGVYVWVAGYIGEQWAGYYQHVPLATHKRPIRAGYRPDHMNAYGITFSVYKLVFQVFGATTSPKGADLRHGSSLGETTHRIWPHRDSGVTILPRRLRFDDAGLSNFADIYIPGSDWSPEA
jgi:hypothetical protein